MRLRGLVDGGAVKRAEPKQEPAAPARKPLAYPEDMVQFKTGDVIHLNHDRGHMYLVVSIDEVSREVEYEPVFIDSLSPVEHHPIRVKTKAKVTVRFVRHFNPARRTVELYGRPPVRVDVMCENVEVVCRVADITSLTTAF